MYMFNKFIKSFGLWFIGGLIYYTIEILWRGYSNFSMFIVGGVCFLLMGLINEVLPWDMSIWKQVLIGDALTTFVELIAGLIVNVWLGMGVWDYSMLPLNFMGQICVPFMLLWLPLVLAGIMLDDYLRYKFCGEDKPIYNWKWK